jgi:hypothetical protein
MWKGLKLGGLVTSLIYHAPQSGFGMSKNTYLLGEAILHPFDGVTHRPDVMFQELLQSLSVIYHHQ